MHTRRHILTSVGAAAAVAAVAPKTFAAWEPSERYPDPALKSLDPSFNRYVHFNAGVERLVTGMRWCEGPVYFGDARCLLWSDIPNNRIMRWDEETGRVSVYRQPSNNANGNTRDRQGRLVTCEHDTRRVTRTEYDGTITVLIDKFDGKPINSPDEKKLYIVEAGLTPRVIRVYDVNEDKLANGRTFVTAEPGGTPDGMRCDVDGNLWCGWGMGNPQQDGVKIFDPNGKAIGFIALPERSANVCFGGVKRNRLFMAASHSVYSLYVNTQGAPGG